MLSVVKGIKSRDQIEAMLASQMAAVHVATLTAAWRLAKAESLPAQDSTIGRVQAVHRSKISHSCPSRVSAGER
jgi:hypothetical protein